MQNLGADWLMTTLAPSPFMVALMQTAENAPLFMLALPAGALADIADRRRLLLLTQSWMLVSAVAFGLLTLFGLTTLWILLTLTFALGLGSALNAPAWQAIMPELVPRPELPSAVALNNYQIEPERAEEFVEAMQEMKRTLRRDGASRRDLFNDPSKPGHYVETFLVES